MPSSRLTAAGPFRRFAPITRQQPCATPQDAEIAGFLAGQLGGPARRHSGWPRIAASRIGLVMSSEWTASLMCDWPVRRTRRHSRPPVVVAAIRIRPPLCVTSYVTTLRVHTNASRAVAKTSSSRRAAETIAFCLGHRHPSCLVTPIEHRLSLKGRIPLIGCILQGCRRAYIPLPVEGPNRDLLWIVFIAGSAGNQPALAARHPAVEAP